jgi:demethoxyubiquinone hydroxylase (CLK1/Coq7/Cat5 family)
MDSLEGLIAILQLAYSGELAAGYAYRGHWRSLANPDERMRIRQIEEEEWHHRRLVGEMLVKLGARPRLYREVRAFVVGRTLGMLCHLAGWFAPMYGAGRLESRNIKEYEEAARHAEASGWTEFLDCLLTMAEVEWEHESYFRTKVEQHPWIRYFHLWPQPPPKATIRAGRPGQACEPRAVSPAAGF